MPPAITVVIDYAVGTSSTELQVPCDDGATQYPRLAAGTQATAPNGTVHVTVAGSLQDATPFTAAADAPML